MVSKTTRDCCCKSVSNLSVGNAGARLAPVVGGTRLSQYVDARALRAHQLARELHLLLPAERGAGRGTHLLHELLPGLSVDSSLALLLRHTLEGLDVVVVGVNRLSNRLAHNTHNFKLAGALCCWSCVVLDSLAGTGAESITHGAQ